VVTTAEPHYTATVKNADGSETKYDIKSYETKEGTMELTLKDGTKVFVPVVNITIAEQTTAVEKTKPKNPPPGDPLSVWLGKGGRCPHAPNTYL